jgi:hypothetical protein
MLRNWFKRILYLFVVIGFSSASAGSYEDFFTAVTRDDATTIAQLLSEGFDSNARSPEGQTALFLALQRDALRVAEVMIWT